MSYEYERLAAIFAWCADLSNKSAWKTCETFKKLLQHGSVQVVKWYGSEEVWLIPPHMLLQTSSKQAAMSEKFKNAESDAADKSFKLFVFENTEHLTPLYADSKNAASPDESCEALISVRIACCMTEKTVDSYFQFRLF